MAEEIYVPETEDKKERYEALLPQIKALIYGEKDLIANMANTAAALKSVFNFFWVGYYLTKENQLVLGPFQGPIACTRIDFNKGVCGASYSKKETIIVPDVNRFPGHIACSSASKSEIVIPGIIEGKVAFVLDVDSAKLDQFDETDKIYLEEMVKMVCQENLPNQ